MATGFAQIAVEPRVFLGSRSDFWAGQTNLLRPPRRHFPFSASGRERLLYHGRIDPQRSVGNFDAKPDPNQGDWVILPDRDAALTWNRPFLSGPDKPKRAEPCGEILTAAPVLEQHLVVETSDGGNEHRQRSPIGHDE